MPGAVTSRHHRMGSAATAGRRLLRRAGPRRQDALAVPVAANGARLRSRDGIDVVADRIPPDEVVVVHGMRCARVERALFDEMRRIGEVREMAVAIGAACAARLTSVRRMRAYVATRRWYRGICLAREAVELAVEGARSPQEDRFRLIWELDAGWGRPLLNRDVFDEHGRWSPHPTCSTRCAGWRASTPAPTTATWTSTRGT